MQFSAAVRQELTTRMTASRHDSTSGEIHILPPDWPPEVSSIRRSQSVDIAAEKASPKYEAQIQLIQARTLVVLGDYEAGHERALAALRLYEQAGEPAGELWSGVYLALARAGVGRIQDAIEQIEEVLDSGQVQGLVHDLDTVRCVTAGIWLNQAGPDALNRARQLANQAMASTSSGQNDWARRVSLAYLAKIHLRQGERSRALIKSHEAVKSLESAQQATGDELLIYFTHANVLRALGDDRAIIYLELARQFLARRCCALALRKYRRSYLYGVPLHRAICEAGDARRAAGDRSATGR